MSCSPFDLKDYVFGELSAQDARTLETHIAGCGDCRGELERLRLTHAALASLRDEELPRRIAFVSDKVFEPNWWQRFWQSGPRLGFASAAMLSLAILTHAFVRPSAPGAAPVASVDAAIVDARVEAEIAKRLPAIVQQSVASMAQAQEQKVAQMLAASEKRLSFERKADLATIGENFDVISKKLKLIEKDRYNMASLGGGQ
jgi:anti-sigma factor RsiW